jgi:type VI protein secretion system component Hcp
MDQNSTDIVMKFVFQGKPVWAECALEIDPKDTLMKGFGQNTGYDNYADFFEVSGFDFGMSLKESDDTNGSTLNQSSHQPAHGQQQQQKPSLPFARWRNATGQDYKNIYFPLEFDEFNFERSVDAASPIFFQNCCNSQTFDSASMVKRISQGDYNQTGPVVRTQFGFLRIDFEKVLITSISWDDGDVVKEKCSFICQKMTIKYRPQLNTGLVDEKSEVTIVWPDERARNIRAGGRP